MNVFKGANFMLVFHVPSKCYKWENMQVFFFFADYLKYLTIYMGVLIPMSVNWTLTLAPWKLYKQKWTKGNQGTIAVVSRNFNILQMCLQQIMLFLLLKSKKACSKHHLFQLLSSLTIFKVISCFFSSFYEYRLICISQHRGKCKNIVNVSRLSLCAITAVFLLCCIIF